MKANSEDQTILDPESGVILHRIIRMSKDLKIVEELKRVDFSRPGEFLQLSRIEIPGGHVFRPHVHLERERTFTNLRAQESWVVMRGTVEVDYYSEAGELIQKETLHEGDVTITFRGGHGYRTLSSSSIVYEFKSGPYEGLEIDKAFL